MDGLTSLARHLAWQATVLVCLVSGGVGSAYGQATEPRPAVRLILPPPVAATEPSTSASLSVPLVRNPREPEGLHRNRIEIHPPPVPFPPLAGPPLISTIPAKSRFDGVPGPDLTAPLREVEADCARFVEGYVNARNTLEVILNRTTVLVFKAPLRRMQPANPHLLAAERLSPCELSLTGRAPGTTVLHLWFADPRDPRGEVLLGYLIHIRAEPVTLPMAGLDQALARLQDQINATFAESAVRLGFVGEQIVIVGQARDFAEAKAIGCLVARNRPGPPGRMALSSAGEAGLMGDNGCIVNLLRVSGEKGDEPVRSPAR